MNDSIKKIIFIFSICAAAVIFFLLTSDEDTDLSNGSEHFAMSEPESDLVPVKNEKTAPESVFIDVKGEVKNPGVYEVAADARVNDVIKTAGGFTSGADEIHINLAQKVHDEMSILVPHRDDSGTTEGNFHANENSGKIRINYAAQEDIENLNGIGPSKAQAIIQYREEHGFFQSAEDLLQVPGIGERTLADFQEQIIVP